VDPVFGLSYQPDQVQFEPAPADLLAKCPALQNAMWTRRLWIYAKTDPKGAMLKTSRAGCRLLGPAREVFRYPDDLVALPVLEALAADLVRRYRLAFGGSAALSRTLLQQHALPAGARDAVLRDALAARD
jgi:hypothetical protein